MGYPSVVHCWSRLQAGAGGELASARSWAGSGSRPWTVGLGVGSGTMSSCWVGVSDMTSSCLGGRGSRPSVYGMGGKKPNANVDE